MTLRRAIIGACIGATFALIGVTAAVTTVLSQEAERWYIKVDVATDQDPHGWYVYTGGVWSSLAECEKFLFSAEYKKNLAEFLDWLETRETGLRTVVAKCTLPPPDDPV